MAGDSSAGSPFCPRCGTYRFSAVRFCTTCGFDFDLPPGQTQPEPTRPPFVPEAGVVYDYFPLPLPDDGGRDRARRGGRWIAALLGVGLVLALLAVAVLILVDVS